jgi:hypothetical protein
MAFGVLLISGRQRRLEVDRIDARIAPSCDQNVGFGERRLGGREAYRDPAMK